MYPDLRKTGSATSTIMNLWKIQWMIMGFDHQMGILMDVNTLQKK
jgi:hypothetical protein